MKYLLLMLAFFTIERVSAQTWAILEDAEITFSGKKAE